MDKRLWRRVYGQTAQSRSSKSMKYKMNQFDKTALPFSQDGMVERFITTYKSLISISFYRDQWQGNIQN